MSNINQQIIECRQKGEPLAVIAKQFGKSVGAIICITKNVQVPKELTLKKAKEKRACTNLEKYGVNNPFQSTEIQEKIKQINLEKYGVEYSGQSDQKQKKTEQTNLERYGAKHHWESADIREKIKETNLIKLGVEHPLQSAEIQEKIKQTNLEKYGVEHPLQNPDILQKVQDTNLERYGTSTSSQNPDVKKKQQASFLPSKIETAKKHYQQFTNCPYRQPKFTEEEFVDYYVSGSTDELEWYSVADIARTYKAPYPSYNCGRIPAGYESNLEIVVKCFLDAYNINHINNCRTILDGLELDFYLPDHNIAIECNGLYWHSSKFRSPDYHLNKSEICASKDIRLIHLWEDEINEKWPIVESRLRSLLNINQTNVYARRCEVKEVDFKTAKQFLEENHLLGKDQANINLGLYYNNQLIAAMTFNKPTTIGSKTTDYILSRYCCLLNHRIVGGPSKLLKHFIKTYQPKNIQTYAEVRFGEGKMYKTLGFDFSHRSRPSYFVVYDGQRRHRQQFMKKHLHKYIEGPLDLSKTEKQICEEHNIHHLYDCGKDVYLLTITV